MALNQAIIYYIVNNQWRYTREAITQQLLKAGFDQLEIEAAWEAVIERGADSRTELKDLAGEELQQVLRALKLPLPPEKATSQFWLILALYGIAILLLSGVLILLNHSDIALAFAVVMFPIGILSANIMLRRNRRPNNTIARFLVYALSVLLLSP